MNYLKQFEQYLDSIAGIYGNVINENKLEDVGREFQHIEDLVYIYGPQGAKRAIDRLASIAKDSSHLELKWDGSPAIIFGRDNNGNFHFGDKYSKEIVGSGESVYQQYVGRSGQNVSDERRKFAGEMSALYDLYERATPKDFRGFIEGALLYKTRPPINNKNEYVFQPNTVIYHVDKDNNLGKLISQSTSASTATAYFDNLPALGGRRITTDLTNIIQGVGNQQVLILPPKYSVEQAQIPTSAIKKLYDFLNSNASSIEEFVTPSPEWIASYPDKNTATKKWREVIYKYVNSQVDVPGGLEKLGSNMAQWAESDPLLTKARRPLAIDKIKNSSRGLTATFTLVRGIMNVKDVIVDQLETKTLGSANIRAELPGGIAGGEGFVSDPAGGTQPLKLIKRGAFTAANRAKSRGGVREGTYRTGQIHKYSLNLVEFENNFGKLLLERDGKYYSNKKTEQAFYQYAVQNNIDTKIYYSALNQQIEKTCHKNKLSESIDSKSENELVSLFQKFRKFSGDSKTVREGESKCLLMLVAEDYGINNRTITLEGFSTPKKILQITNNQIIFEDGTRYPSDSVVQTRIWKQVELFESSNQLEKCLTMMALTKEKINSGAGDWKFDAIDIDSILKEDSNDKTAVVGWGRGMGHKGHMYLASSVIEYAKKIGATPFFFVSETVGKDDPLDTKTKLAIYKTVFPQYKNIFKTGKNPIQISQEVFDLGYKNLVFVVGADQKESFQFLSKPTKSTGALPVPFDSVKVMSRQETDTSSSGMEGPRATGMREALKNSDLSYEEKFEVWRRDMPEQLSDKQVTSIMKQAAKTMGVSLEDTVQEADLPPQGGLSSPIPGTPKSLQPQPDPEEIEQYHKQMKDIERFLGRKK